MVLKIDVRMTFLSNVVWLSPPKQRKKVNRKVQEESQAEAAANPRHQEEEKKWHRLTYA